MAGLANSKSYDFLLVVFLCVAEGEWDDKSEQWRELEEVDVNNPEKMCGIVEKYTYPDTHSLVESYRPTFMAGLKAELEEVLNNASFDYYNFTGDMILPFFYRGSAELSPGECNHAARAYLKAVYDVYFGSVVKHA